MTFRRSDYHHDWKSIVRQIKDQAGNRCEFCGVPNGSYGARDVFGGWHDAESIAAMPDEEAAVCWPETWAPDRWITIVLTTAHLCWRTCADTRCIDPGHLACLCQRCHLNWDRDHHREVQRRNREAKRRQVQPALLEMI